MAGRAITIGPYPKGQLVLFVDVDDPELSTVGDRLLYRGEPFTGETTESLPDFTEIETVSYENGCRDGSCRGWHPNGTMRYSGVFGDGRKVGLWRHWSAVEQLVGEDEFDPSGGLRHRKRWNDAGVLVEDFDAAALAKPAVRGAVARVDAQLESDAMWHEGRPFTGQIVTYFYDGGPIVQVEWANGLSVEYDAGRERRKGVADASGPVGCWYEYRPDGRISREACYNRRHRLLLDRHWDEEGVLVRPASGLALLHNDTNEPGRADE